MTIPTHGKDCGPNDLVVIMSSSIGAGASHVVRWCQRCGGIVVDVDVDNRINAGQGMKMRFPKYG